MVLNEYDDKIKNKTFKKSLNDDFEDKTSKHVHSENNILNGIDEDVFKREARRISTALQEGTIKLSLEEENKLKRDIDVILSSFDNNIDDFESDISEGNEQTLDNVLNNDIDLFNNIRDDLSNYNSDFFNNNAFDDIIDGLTNNVLVDKSYENNIDNDVSLNNHIDSNYSPNIQFEKLIPDNKLDNARFNNVGTLNDGNKEIAIKVDNVTMEYKITQEKIDTVKEFVIRTIKRNKTSSTKFTALKNVSFEIPKGDRVGIVGFNGAGKSTLLKILSGVYDPTEGDIEINGKLAPLLELGAGFDHNYSGKSNIFLNGAFLGFSEDFLKEKYDEIVEFSELGESINYPVKNYSSGMRAKLGFSIATLVEPDILIIDEILSVGDIKFQRKSAKKLKSLINSGITVLLVSHSVSQIRDICNKAIWIDNGEIKMMGDVNTVCDAYVKAADDATDEQLKNINLN